MDDPKYTKPTKHVVRMYMRERLQSSSPPPSPEEINRQLGRHLVDQTRKGKQKR